MSAFYHDSAAALVEDGRIVMVNEQAERTFGHAASAMVGESVEMLIPERFRDRHGRQVNDYFADPERREMGEGMELLGIRADGSEFPIEIGLNPVTLNGETTVLAAIIDITKRKKAQEALMESEEKFRQMLVQSPLSIEIHNPAGYIEEANQAWMDLWGVKDEEELEALKASWCILEDEQVTSLGVMPAGKPRSTRCWAWTLAWETGRVRPSTI